jgi:lipoprotein-anchoring transpeptidase ErfK/SrfK
LLSGKDKRVGSSLYRETKDGKWLKASDLGVVRQPDDLPPAAKAGEKWIDISIENQTLVLWEGMKPVYATLVSTGQDGMKDPKTTKSTIRGVFRIKNKHITATMDSNERSSAGGGPAPAANADVSDRDGRDRSAKGGGDGSSDRDAEYGKTVRRGQGSFELRDVPYVEYFEAGYALHAAYWHDVFGTARSHGCVNLSPVDAHRVFLWTDPPIPDGWHGVNASPETGEGTTVSIHK